MENCLEVTLLGPGYGESVLINIGDNNWIVIDSCKGNNGEPAAIEYFNDNKVSLERVILIVATHWHDDHIWGLSKLVSECKNAMFCTSIAFSKKEFHSFVLGLSKRFVTSGVRSGVKEINHVFNVLEARRKNKSCTIPDIKYSTADRVIQRFEASNLSHGQEVEIWSLSPSDAEIEHFLKDIGTLLPLKEGEVAGVVKEIKPNQSCTVIQVKFGDHISMLFGADLEERGHSGWSQIHSSSGRPKDKSIIFKIPHHGSVTGHHDGVWNDMVVNNAVCLLTPYSRGYKLPQDSDLARIVKYSENTYVTQSSVVNKGLQKSKLVKSQLDGVAKPIDDAFTSQVGQISVSLCKAEIGKHSTPESFIDKLSVLYKNGAYKAPITS